MAFRKITTLDFITPQNLHRLKFASLKDKLTVDTLVRYLELFKVRAEFVLQLKFN